MKEYRARLKKAIRDLHHCEAEYIGTVPVTEKVEGEIVWDGEIEVFAIRGHPKAKRAYAWSHFTGTSNQGIRYVVVLELPPVDSPQTAVRAAIASEISHPREKDG